MCTGSVRQKYSSAASSWCFFKARGHIFTHSQVFIVFCLQWTRDLSAFKTCATALLSISNRCVVLQSFNPAASGHPGLLLPFFLSLKASLIANLYLFLCAFKDCPEGQTQIVHIHRRKHPSHPEISTPFTEGHPQVWLSPHACLAVCCSERFQCPRMLNLLGWPCWSDGDNGQWLFLFQGAPIPWCGCWNPGVLLQGTPALGPWQKGQELPWSSLGSL